MQRLQRGIMLQANIIAVMGSAPLNVDDCVNGYYHHAFH